MQTVVMGDTPYHYLHKEWPTGHTELYRPTLYDILAEDWVTAPFPQAIPGKGYQHVRE